MNMHQIIALEKRIEHLEERAETIEIRYDRLQDLVNILLIYNCNKEIANAKPTNPMSS